MFAEVLHIYTRFKYAILSWVCCYVATHLLVVTQGIKNRSNIWQQEGMYDSVGVTISIFGEKAA